MLVGEGEQEFLLCERCGTGEERRPARARPGPRADPEAQFGYRARFSHFPIVRPLQGLQLQVAQRPPGACGSVEDAYQWTLAGLR